MLNTLLSRRRQYFAALLFLLLGAAPALAGASESKATTVGEYSCPAPSPARAAELLNQNVLQQMHAQHMPGASLVVINHGKVEHLRAYGYANLENCAPATIHTLFGIGSISKQFTAVGALTLVRDGVISLDDPITKYLTEGVGVWDQIKVRHLLTHTSGIPDYCGDDSKFPSITLDRTSMPATTELIRQIARAPLNFRPGDDWAYSNTGYLILSALIERASGQPFPEFMRARVFMPLGMNATRYYSPTEVIPRRATPYHVSDGVVTNGPFISDQFSRWGDMGMLSTAEDMGRWLSALGTNPLLPANLWREMLTPVRLNDGSSFPYGFGIQFDTVENETLWSHSGTFRVGYSAQLLYVPTRHVGVAMLSNHWGDTLAVREIATDVLSSVVPDLEPLSKRQVRPDPQPKFTASLLRFLQGKDAAHGAAAMTAALALHDDFHRRLAQALSGSATAALAFIECRDVTETPPDGMGSPISRQCSYRLTGQPGLPSGIVFWLTAKNEVAGLSLW